MGIIFYYYFILAANTGEKRQSNVLYNSCAYGKYGFLQEITIADGSLNLNCPTFIDTRFMRYAPTERIQDKDR